MANNSFPGVVAVDDTGSQTATIVMDGDSATLRVGAKSAEFVRVGQVPQTFDGQIVVLDTHGNQAVHIYASSGATMKINGPDGTPGLYVSASASAGGKDAAIQLDGKSGNIILRSAANLGQTYQDSIRLQGRTAELLLGGSGVPGTIVLQGGAPLDGTFGNTIRLEGGTANLFLGGAKQAGTIVLRDNASKDSIRLDGQLGDIQLLNADIAEEFDVSELEPFEPGTVMVFDPDGYLRECREPYDKKVAGVHSGGEEFRPGIVLDKRATDHTRVPVALMGKVLCKADAGYASIEIGDLLTTSATPGHAMKVIDRQAGFGAIIGKAMSNLNAGTGLIRMLVNLQ